MSSLLAALGKTDADLLVPAATPDGRGNRVCIWGPEGTGKTHFMLSRPGPMFLFDFEHNVEKVLAHLPPREVVVNKYPVILSGEQRDAIPVADKFLKDYHKALGDLERAGLGPADVTLGIDSISRVRTLMQLAYVDKDVDGKAPPKAYEKFNNKWEGIFAATAFMGQVLICTARASDAWGMVEQENGKKILGPTGALKAEWAPRTGHDLDAVIEISFRSKVVDGKRVPVRSYRVSKCTSNQKLKDKYLEELFGGTDNVDYQWMLDAVATYAG
jgi:hypothetical protein